MLTRAMHMKMDPKFSTWVQVVQAATTLPQAIFTASLLVLFSTATEAMQSAGLFDFSLPAGHFESRLRSLAAQNEDHSESIA